MYNNLPFLVFLILEVIAFGLLLNRDSFRQSVFFRASTVVSANIQSVTTAVSSYFGLKTSNALLSEENAALKNRVADLEAEVDTLRILAHRDSEMEGILADTIHQRRNLSFLSAKVVDKTLFRFQNYIIINRGERDGVAPDMGVISPQGVVGVVQRVSDNYAVVIPVINTRQLISAKLKKSGHLGSVSWNGKNIGKASLNEIPTHVSAEKGDAVVTSGYSVIFPPDELIGYVSDTSQDNNYWSWNIEIDLAVDFHSLDYVTVVVYSNKPEFSTLWQTVSSDEK